MTREQIEKIVTERLTAFGRMMVDNHATPLIAVGIGHDHEKGKHHVVRPDGMSDEQMSDLLHAIANKIYTRPSMRRTATLRESWRRERR